MPVHQHLSRALLEAQQRYPNLWQDWVGISHRVGSRLPRSLLPISLQRAGKMDVIVRALEDEVAATLPDKPPADILLYDWLNTFSTYWVADVYDSCYLLKKRNLEPHTAFADTFTDIDLLRAGLDKHEVPKDWALKGPLEFFPHPPRPHDKTPDVYDPKDEKKAHIMPQSLTPRGSCCWQVIDPRKQAARWVERRDLSDRLLRIWLPGSD